MEPQTATCSTCAAFASTRPEHGYGECRRRAPTLADADICFPPVKPTSWCLEFVPLKGGAQ